MNRPEQNHPKPYYLSEHHSGRVEEIDLFELCRTLWRGKLFIAFFVILSTLGTYLVCSFLLKPIYRAEATLNSTSESSPVITSYLSSTKLKRNLIEKYNLLPVLYSDSWDHESETWRVKNSRTLPTVQTALSEGKLPLKVENGPRLIWEGPDPVFNVLMLERVINELDNYLENEFISNAQVQISIFELELKPIITRFEEVWDQFWSMDKVNLATIDLMREYARLKGRISDLQSNNALSRKYSVVNEPIAMADPIFPNTKIMVAATFVGSSIFSIFAVSFYNALQRSRRRTWKNEA
jgi:hypothetical protein